MSGEKPKTSKQRVLVAGASGTIGQAVLRTLVDDGHEVVALLRPDGRALPQANGTETCSIKLTEPEILTRRLHEAPVDVVISCIASRSGTAQDAQAVDFFANQSLLKACEATGVQHFILLSAICVQRPKLAFQHAKLAFEEVLKASPIDHTVIRPTAFFKSLSGQIDRVLAGKPFLLFGDGELTRCKPISDADLARFIVDSMGNDKRRNMTLPIGGSGPAITLKEQGALLFEAAGLEPKFRSVPIGLFTLAVGALGLVSWISRGLAEKAEYARIGRYYATESMLLLDPETGQYSAEKTAEFGSDTLFDHYRAEVSARRGS